MFVCVTLNYLVNISCYINFFLWFHLFSSSRELLRAFHLHSRSVLRFWLSFPSQLWFRFGNCARFGGVAGEVEEVAGRHARSGSQQASQPVSQSVSSQDDMLRSVGNITFELWLIQAVFIMVVISNIAWAISHIPISEAGWRHRQPNISVVFKLLNIWCCFYGRRPKIWY